MKQYQGVTGAVRFVMDNSLVGDDSTHLFKRFPLAVRSWVALR